MLLSVLEDDNRLQIVPLCQSEARVMLLLHLLCSDRTSLLRDACCGHTGTWKEKVLGLITPQTFYPCSLCA